MHLLFIEHRSKIFLISTTIIIIINIKGQTLNRVLFDVRENVFSHGALYVALSRVRKFSNIAFLITNEKIAEDGGILLKNIVYKDILV